MDQRGVLSLSAAKLRRRKRLFAEHPFCHWCRKRLTDVPLPDGRLPRNFATLDHLRDRADPLRLERYARGQKPEPRTVLACRACKLPAGERDGAEDRARAALIPLDFPPVGVYIPSA